MKLYLNSNYEIEKIEGSTKLAMGNDNFDTIDVIMATSLADDGIYTVAPSFAFRLPNGRVMGDYTPSSTQVSGSNIIFSYFVSELVLAVKGTLQATITLNFFKNTALSKKKCISISLQVINSIKINDELYYLGEDASTSLFSFKNNILANTAELTSLSIKTAKTLEHGRKLTYKDSVDGIYTSFQIACSDVFDLFFSSPGDTSETCSLRCSDANIVGFLIGTTEVATLVFFNGTSNKVGMYNSVDNNYYRINKNSNGSYSMSSLFVRNDEIQSKYLGP